MGGPGSGKHPVATKMKAVEDGLRLSIRDLRRVGLLPPQPGRKSTLRWTVPNGSAPKEAASVEVATDMTAAERLCAMLRYVVVVGGTTYRVEEPVDLFPTPQRFGGSRWWFCCPAIRGGSPCGRLASKLYLPRGERFFACRSCHRLSYRSRQEYHPQTGEGRAPTGGV